MKTLAFVVSIILIVAGFLFWLTPVPGGLPSMALGIALLIYSSDRAARIITAWRNSHDRFNRAFTWIENSAPSRLGDTLRRTRP